MKKLPRFSMLVEVSFLGLASILTFLLAYTTQKNFQKAEITKAAFSTYYISTTGNDANPGTLAQPFATIQKGLNSLSGAGDILYIRGGTYNIGKTDFVNKSGLEGQNIVISGYQNERPRLDASGRIPSLWDHFVNLSNLRHVTIQNLEFLNSRGRGIYLYGSDNVTFRNVWVHDTALAAIWAENTNNLTIEDSRFWSNNQVNRAGGPWYRSNNWMGAVTVRGPDSTTAPHATNITIRKNEIFESYGECINAHGRVSNLTIEDNMIYNCWAPAIYYPNSRDILIQRNLVYHTNDSRFLRNDNPSAGIGSMREGPPTRPGEMRNIRVVNNFVKGFASNFFFWQNMGGQLQDTLIAHNTFVDAHSNTSVANNINIQPGPHINTRFENNIVLQDDTSGAIGQSDGSIAFSNNLWSRSAPSSMQGAGDIVANPRIARSGSTTVGGLQPAYFSLLTDSPAINKGRQLTITEDFFKKVRVGPDIGAHEYEGVVITPIPTTSATATPRPTASLTPRPTATATPRPTATPSPRLTASVTPMPTATPTPRSTSTTPSSTSAPTPAPTNSPTLSAVGSFKAEYFDNRFLSGKPSLVRYDKAINFDWGKGSPAPSVIKGHYFSTRWTKTENFAGGKYRFTLKHDDGLRIYLDGKLIYDKWGSVVKKPITIDQFISSGSHNLKVEYREIWGNNFVFLSYSKLP